MIELTDRKIDDYGNVIYTKEGIVDRILSDLSIENCIIDDIDEFYKNENFKNIYDSSIESLSLYSEPQESLDQFDLKNQNDLFIPEEYKHINLYVYLMKTCSSEEEITRMEYEYNLIKERNMLSFFKCMIYLVDNFRKHNVVWGVGRGSSVSSFALYKIGIHKVNSILYNLDCHEFFK